jgi:hypothetical protein
MYICENFAWGGDPIPVSRGWALCVGPVVSSPAGHHILTTLFTTRGRGFIPHKIFAIFPGYLSSNDGLSSHVFIATVVRVQAAIYQCTIYICTLKGSKDESGLDVVFEP